jgi:probable phosphoglycerate mutase
MDPTDHVDAILLIRHGQSEWNAAKRWQGMADSPLTEFGRDQAAAAADALAAMVRDPAVGLRFGELWASHLGRARATAAVIGARLGLDEIHSEPRLREVDAGPWEGLSLDEIEVSWPGYLEQARRPDGFETLDSVIGRALAALRDLAARALAAHQPLIVVTHSGVMRAIRSHFGQVGTRVGNLDGCWITAAAGDPTPQIGLGETLTLLDESLMTPGGFEQRH